MLRKTLLMLLLSATFAIAVAAEDSRHFTFRYEFTVRNITPGERVRIWIPLAHSDQFQTVKLVSSTGDLPLKQTREREYGNEMLYAAEEKAAKAEYHFAVEYDVVRNERVVPLSGTSHLAAAKLSERERQRFLEPDRLVPVNGLPAEIAVREVAGRSTDLDRARALYDYVFRTMKYDKSGTGWGRGDTLWACDSKRGNCTDFHSLFISMARSQKIPARYEMGFSIPTDKHSGEVPGYHCWSDFYLKGTGWVPVDISEAWKHPEKHDYFFGAHDVHRVQFTVGRDLTLSPPQQGQPLNYFVFPYVEVDGKEFSNVATRNSFSDVSSGTAVASR
ncbi:MAG TPA: transglutaminase-like domain-containing protein [Terriglobales bacterium]|nr:transglutaminase-like domain-containing protein [Terriglobales bacterium]